MAWGLELAAVGACGFALYNIIDPGCVEPETLPYDLGSQALHLVEVQDPVNCSFI